jgi:hypothetical protein
MKSPTTSMSSVLLTFAACSAVFAPGCGTESELELAEEGSRQALEARGSPSFPSAALDVLHHSVTRDLRDRLNNGSLTEEELGRDVRRAFVKGAQKALQSCYESPPPAGSSGTSAGPDNGFSMDIDYTWPTVELRGVSPLGATVGVSGAVGVECSGIYRYSTSGGCEIECVLGISAEVEVAGEFQVCPIGGLSGKVRPGNYDVDVFGSIGVRFGGNGSIDMRADSDGNWSLEAGICIGF